MLGHDNSVTRSGKYAQIRIWLLILFISDMDSFCCTKEQNTQIIENKFLSETAEVESSNRSRVKFLGPEQSRLKKFYTSNN